MITDKEKQILTLLAEGKTQREVARAVHCSRPNVNRIVHDLFFRFDVVNTPSLVAFAVANELISIQKHIRREQKGK